MKKDGMGWLLILLIAVLIFSFPGCDCGGGRNVHDQNTKGAVEKEQADTMYVPPVPEEEQPATEEHFGKAKKPKWNYPTPVPQPPPTNTTCEGTLCIYIEFEGGVMQHPAYNNGQPVTLLNSGFTEEQKEQVLAVAQSYFIPPIVPQALNIIVTRDINIYNQSKNRLKTYATQSDWYNGAIWGGYTSAQLSYTICNDAVNFVYVNRLAYHPRYCGQEVVHEAGHWLDFNHEYNSQGGLLSCTIMGNPLDCNPASWGGYLNTLQQILGAKQ